MKSPKFFILSERKETAKFDFIERAVNDRLLTGAVQLVDAVGFARGVSTLGRFASL